MATPWKDCSTKAWFFLIEAIRPFQHWSFPPFISWGSEEVGAKLNGHPMTISSGESLWVSKGVDMRFRSTNSVQFSHSVVSDSLRPHEPQHSRPPCPSPTPRVHPNPCPSSRWCHPTISSSVGPFSSCPQSFPESGYFSNESALPIRWPKYWSFGFNISPSNEHPGLISFRMDWLDLLAVQGTLKSLLQHHSSKASILWHSAFF